MQIFCSSWTEFESSAESDAAGFESAKHHKESYALFVEAHVGDWIGHGVEA